MSSPKKPRTGRGGRVRTTFRWCRRIGYVAGLMLVGLMVWVNQVGLPGLLKAPLLEQLEDRGIVLEFGRLRVRLTRGLVAESVNLSRVGAQGGEHFFSEDVRIRLRWGALLEGGLPEVKELVFEQGDVILNLPTGEGSPGKPFAIREMEGRVRFVTPDLWEIDGLEGVHDRFSVVIGGTVTNALHLRRARKPDAKPGEERWREQLLRVSRWLEETEFGSAPAVKVDFRVDAAQPERSAGELSFSVAGVSNRWFGLDHLRLGVRMVPGTGDGAVWGGKLNVEATGVRSEGVELGWMQGVVGMDWPMGKREPDRMEWEVRAGQLAGRGVRTAGLEIRGTTRSRELEGAAEAPWTVPPEEGNWAERRGVEPGFETGLRLVLTGLDLTVSTQRIEVARIQADIGATHTKSGWRRIHSVLAVDDAESGVAGVTRMDLEADLMPRLEPPRTEEGWGFWRRWVHVEGRGRLGLGETRLPREFGLDGLRSGWKWEAPRLRLDPFLARFGGGDLQGEADLDVGTRRAWATASSTADPHAVLPWMGTNTQQVLQQYGWQKGGLPRLWGQVGIQLPGWGLPGPEERQRLLGSLTLDAQMDVTNATFRGLGADRGTGRLTYTNRFWRIGPLQIRRPEGDIHLTYENDELTKEYHFGIRSGVDPKIVRPLLEEKAQKELDRIDLPVPPQVEGEVWGRWKAPEETGFRARLEVTNLTVRGQSVDWASGHVAYTNRVMTFRDVKALAGGEAWVPGATYDMTTQLLSFTNARANVPVMSVARVIGPKTLEALEPYRFEKPPRAVVNGVVSVRGPQGTDIVIEAEVEDFRWWRLKATNATARVRFKDETLTISGLQAGYNGGDLAGNLWFDWTGDGPDTDYRLDLAITNVSFPGLVGDLWQRTNRLEGLLTGRGEVTSASTRDTVTIVGSGDLSLSDGFLWGLPMFGMFSPLFDTLSPGLGQSRFTSGSASFRMTNGIIDTRDFEMRSATMRLQYRGTVDWEGRMDATMEAELLRDVPLVGRLLQFAFTPVTKLLEYRVRGTLREPRPEPRYIPKFLLSIFRPISLLKNLLPKEDDDPAVAPAAPVEPLKGP